MKLTVLIISFFVTQYSSANDGYAAFGTGGNLHFSKSENISMETEKLTISPDLVKVRYRFKNNANKMVKSIIAFPLPEIKCGYWEVNDYARDFTVFVDGRLIVPKKEIRAFKGKNEVTKLLIKNNLPIDCTKVYEDKSRKTYMKVQDLGLADTWNDPQDIHYVSKIKYYWEQGFPAKKEVIIEHSYKPVRGASVGVGPHSEKNKWRSFVPTKFITSAVYVKYILTTASTWKGSIKNFQLILDVGKNRNIKYISSSIGPMVKIAKGKYKFEAENFLPSKELDITFAPFQKIGFRKGAISVIRDKEFCNNPMGSSSYKDCLKHFRK